MRAPTLPQTELHLDYVFSNQEICAAQIVFVPLRISVRWLGWSTIYSVPLMDKPRPPRETVSWSTWTSALGQIQFACVRRYVKSIF